MVLFVGHSRPWCSENAGASIRYLESGDFIGKLCFLLGRSVPCRRRPAGDGAPSGPRVARVAHASLKSSDKRHRVTYAWRLHLVVNIAPIASLIGIRRKRFTDRQASRDQSRAQLVLCCGSRCLYQRGRSSECLHLNSAMKIALPRRTTSGVST